MTREQEELLKLQVRTGNYSDKTGFLGKIPNHDGDVCFLCDGEVIEFTKFDYTARNVECEINGDHIASCGILNYLQFIIHLR